MMQKCTVQESVNVLRLSMCAATAAIVIVCVNQGLCIPEDTTGLNTEEQYAGKLMVKCSFLNVF